MPLHDFTSAGIGNKLSDLYAFDDSDLLIQARAMASDFEGWLHSNFALTDKQKDYLDKTPAHVKFYWGVQVAAAIVGRGVIIKEDVPDYGPPRRTKEIAIGVSGGNKYFPPVAGIGTLTGSTTLTLSYALVD